MSPWHPLLPTPMNQAKAVFAKLSILYLELHNSMTLCNYTLPGWASPLKSRNYRGDIGHRGEVLTRRSRATPSRGQIWRRPG